MNNTTMTPEQKSNIQYELQECFNMLAFLAEATVLMLDEGDAYSKPIIGGAQTCLFHLQARLKGAITEFEGGTGK